MIHDEPRLTRPLAIDGGTPVRDRFLVFGRPAIGEEEIGEVVDSLRSGWIGTGPKVGRLEEAFRTRTGAQHAVAVSSCTAALHLSLMAAGAGPGDEVITTPLTFGATANAILHTGATPVFADVDPLTQNISPAAIEEVISPSTRAILPVHFGGYPVDMTAITRLADAHGSVVVDDAAHCIEGSHRGAAVGTLGDATCFSFYPTKNMTTIEGGMITTPREEWAAETRLRSMHGLSTDAWERFQAGSIKHSLVTAMGFKYNMTDIQASVGLHQLAKLDQHRKVRAHVWSRYDEAFVGLPLERPRQPQDGSEHALHLYTVQLELEKLRVGRDEVFAALRAENIGCGVHYISLHLHPLFGRDDGAGRFPHATRISERTLSLPLAGNLTDGDVDDVIEAVTKVLSAYRV
jgi:dTDP-4-amino-4,6-dideoxygalactose transaminase